MVDMKDMQYERFVDDAEYGARPLDLTAAEEEQVIRDLLAAAMLMAPNSAAQMGFAALARTREPGEYQIRALVNAMSDGLRFGNWPVAEYQREAR